MSGLLAITHGLTASWFLAAGKAPKPVLRLSGMVLADRQTGQVVNLELSRESVMALNEACERCLAQIEVGQQ